MTRPEVDLSDDQVDRLVRARAWPEGPHWEQLLRLAREVSRRRAAERGLGCGFGRHICPCGQFTAKT